MNRRAVPLESFVEMLSKLEQGGVVEEIEDHLRNVVRKVTETNQAGSVTITLKVMPGNSKKSSNQIRIEEKVASSVPRLSGESIFFATETGDLSRHNPEQGALSFEKEIS
jgi:hypothetical protein